MVVATYYIWEPSDVYLAPRNYNVWQHVYGGSNGERGVIATYLLTTIDRTLYQEVGFLSGGNSYVSEKDGASIAYGVVNANKNGTLYQHVKGMLPHNSLGRTQLKKLRVYAGSEHQNQAQKPEIWEVK